MFETVKRLEGKVKDMKNENERTFEILKAEACKINPMSNDIV